MESYARTVIFTLMPGTCVSRNKQDEDNHRQLSAGSIKVPSKMVAIIVPLQSPWHHNYGIPRNRVDTQRVSAPRINRRMTHSIC